MLYERLVSKYIYIIESKRSVWSQKYINHKPLPTAPKGFVESFGKKQLLWSFWSCNTLDEIRSAFLKRSKTVLGNSYLLESEINSYLNNTEEVDRVNDLDVAPAETKLFRATNVLILLLNVVISITSSVGCKYKTYVVYQLNCNLKWKSLRGTKLLRVLMTGSTVLV